ncbi:MAG: YlxR family protein [Marmoricola sp.]
MASRIDITVRTDDPVRTCVGCRRRAAKRELLRVVAGTDAAGQDTIWHVVPDPRGTASGRGAHLHPTAECLALAERKRAFVRALRHDAGVRGALSLERLREHLTSTASESEQNWSISS